LALYSPNFAAHALHVILHYVEFLVWLLVVELRQQNLGILVLVLFEPSEYISELLIGYLLFLDLVFLRAVSKDLVRISLLGLFLLIGVLLPPQLKLVVRVLQVLTVIVRFLLVFTSTLFHLIDYGAFI